MSTGTLLHYDATADFKLMVQISVVFEKEIAK